MFFFHYSAAGYEGCCKGCYGNIIPHDSQLALVLADTFRSWYPVT